MEGGSNENGPKRRKTRRLGRMFVFFSFYFLNTVLIIIYRHQRLPPPPTSTATRVKGPNDVVWAVTSPRDPTTTQGTRDATTTATPTAVVPNDDEKGR